MSEINKKIVFSGIQPSGEPTLGNYLGALKNWVLMQDEYECFYSIVDLHSITVRQDPAALRAQIKKFMALFLAIGLDPEKCTLFCQSHVPTHAELAWILNCYTMFGELSRMTQFKDKSQKHADNINAGLFTYPSLMAADMLLYQTDVVPVGIDQKQHIELARNIAVRFNGIYGDTFKIPEGVIPKTSAKINSLADPTKKMSKSDENINSYILLLDKPDDIIRKFKRAVTDSEAIVRYSPEDKPGISNLMNIYSAVTSKTHDEIEKEFDGKGYGDFKLAVGEAVADLLKPVQSEYERIMKDKDYLEKIYSEGAQKAYYVSNKTLSKVYKKVGFIKKGF
ncbi:MAG: tryptophan--tRNA ligase [Clostridia bacterium]|nr:tryptophan--tRNA ligase [Clostridia bacterium]